MKGISTHGLFFSSIGAVAILFMVGCAGPAAPQAGSIAVTSNPPGARVFLDGSDTGQVTPYTIPDVSGYHTIRLTLAGHSDWGPRRVFVTSGQTATIVAVLEPLEPEPQPPEPDPPRPTGGRMYWTDWGAETIARANLDGTGREVLVTGLDNPKGIAIHGGKVYWTEGFLSRIGRITRANLDGTGLEVLITRLDAPQGIAIHGDKMYWTNSGWNLTSSAAARYAGAQGGPDVHDRVFLRQKLRHFDAVWLQNQAAFLGSAEATGGRGTIERANLDGTGREVLVTGLYGGYGITIHGGKMYWTQAGGLYRANLDGTRREELVDNSIDGKIYSMDGIAIHDGKMYWPEDLFSGPGRIVRANLDGTRREVLVTRLYDPEGIAIHGGKMYWTDYGDDTIQRANLDGTGREVLVTGLRSPGEIEIVP